MSQCDIKVSQRDIEICQQHFPFHCKILLILNRANIPKTGLNLSPPQAKKPTWMYCQKSTISQFYYWFVDVQYDTLLKHWSSGILPQVPFFKMKKIQFSLFFAHVKQTVISIILSFNQLVLFENIKNVDFQLFSSSARRFPQVLVRIPKDTCGNPTSTCGMFSPGLIPTFYSSIWVCIKYSRSPTNFGSIVKSSDSSQRSWILVLPHRLFSGMVES